MRSKACGGNETTYTVETLDDPYSGMIPWEDASRVTGLDERKAIKLLIEADRFYCPEGGGWSGHARIVGSDNWEYRIDPLILPGERSTLQRLFHLDD